MSFDISGKISFDEYAINYPADVIREYIEIFKTQTQGKVLLGINNYEDELNEEGMPLLASSFRALAALTQTVNVQDKLGEINGENFRYEVFFYSDELSQYKYRLMFIEHGIGGYPAKIYIANEIVRSINDEMHNSNIQIITGDEELKMLLDCILSCRFTIQIIQEIVNALNRKKYLEAKEIDENKNDE